MLIRIVVQNLKLQSFNTELNIEMPQHNNNNNNLSFINSDRHERSMTTSHIVWTDGNKLLYELNLTYGCHARRPSALVLILPTLAGK